MFHGKGSQYPPWSKKKRNEPYTMPIKTSVELQNGGSVMKKTIAAVKSWFKK